MEKVIGVVFIILLVLFLSLIGNLFMGWIIMLVGNIILEHGLHKPTMTYMVGFAISCALSILGTMLSSGKSSD